MSEDKRRAELTKILANKPNWIIRWGITILWTVLAFAGLIFVIFCKK